ncbi:hypothetical protein D3C81_1998690 [compost metagenome]
MLARDAPLELHYGERPAQRLVGYLDRTVKWHVHVQHKVNGSRNEKRRDDEHSDHHRITGRTVAKTGKNERQPSNKHPYKRARNRSL